MYADIVKSQDRWRVECLLSHKHGTIEQKFMRHVIDETTPYYLCNRPPGASGACIVTKSEVVYGHVGPTIGMPTCIDVGCEMVDGHCIKNIHAEVRAIMTAAVLGIKTKGAVIYSILKPCYNCSTAIILAGITHIFYAGIAYDEDRTKLILSTAGVGSTYIESGLDYAQELV